MTDNTKAGLSPANDHDEIDLSRLVGVLLDHRWLITGVTTLFVVIGIIYSIFSTPIYQADAMVQVEQNAGNSILSDFSQMLPSSQPASATEIELISSRMVIGKTIEDLKLEIAVSQDYFPVFGRGWERLTGKEPSKVEISRLTVPENLVEQPLELKSLGANRYSLSFDGTTVLKGTVGTLAEGNGIHILVSDIKADEGTTFQVVKRLKLNVINTLLRNLTVEDKGKDTGVLALSLTGDDQVRIREILDSITKNYLLQNVERKSEEAGKSLTFLKEQIPEVRAKLDASEDLLNKYRQKNDSVDLSLETKAVLDSIVSVETQLNESTFREAEISKLYTKQHPAYRALLEKRQTLEDERKKLNQRIGTMPKTQQEILRLTRDVQVEQEIFMQLLNKEQELNVTKASTVGNVRIIDPALTQINPVQPRKSLIILLAIFVGGILSIGFVLLKTMLHKGIDNPEALEEHGINVYASIPLSEWQQKKDIELANKRGRKVSSTDSVSLLAIGNPADLAIEAIRSLRTSLHFAMMEANNNVIMISGASPNIGKTFVSINLAAVIAQTGQRVLVIDADMRKGYSHTLVGTEHTNGLSDYLSGKTSKEQAIRSTNIAGMDFIPRGQIPPNPSELLMHARLSELLNWAGDNYDLILIDTPPVLAVTDASIIGRLAGTSLMVARFGVNTVKEVDFSIRRFEQNGINIKGIILNAVEKRASNYYGGYGYYQYSYTSDKKQ
ncbi:tyrosine-protein kinase Wzc [Serratia sp. AKBS12]|uniref:tyrosine-protein kinase Wzc n=1 Tax=Serratia sp. AKBS12 TaxID=2974597 RepID=UPI0021655BDE|nr:tyrosine-protein kinase Wzc [Serratia sp. AKBS12]MCS3409378.1 tyrosine-protein kinase Wzc [Serratia sp. AKBS12]HEI8865693.1 tyrosine-protein kinase Wzc [Serratia odorifera]